MPLKTKITKKQANKLFIIQCLDEIDVIGPTTDDFNNIVYPMNAKLVKGSPIVFGKENQYKIEQGDSFEWQISKALYNTITDMGFTGKAKLGIKMDVTADSTAWVVSNPEDAVFDDVRDDDSQVDDKLQYGYKDVKHRDDNRSLEIKWGMSFNKACDITIARHSADAKFFEDMDEVQVYINDLTHRLMNVATGLNVWLNEKGESERFEHSKGDEDLPF